MYEQGNIKYNKNDHMQSKRPERHRKSNASINEPPSPRGDSRQTRSDRITLLPKMRAARAVFNTVGSAIISIRELSLTNHTA